MKTTVELPDPLFRQAKAAAAQQGISLKEFFTEALRVRVRASISMPAEPPWMSGFGALRDLHSENKRLDRLIRNEFERIEPEDWR